MGQRSQIYVRFNNEEGKKELIARYYGWNFSERMISRARHTIEWLKETKSSFCMREKLPRIMDTNFDLKDVVISTDIIKEYADDQEIWDCTLNEFFENQDNNNGVLLIDIIENTIKYAFLSWDMKYLGDGNAYMKEEDALWLFNGADEYHDQDDIDTCLDNIAWLNENATLLTEDECDEFLHYDYNWQLKNYRPTTPQAILLSVVEQEILTEKFLTIQEAKIQMRKEFDSVIGEIGYDMEELINKNLAEITEMTAKIKAMPEYNYSYNWKIVEINQAKTM